MPYNFGKGSGTKGKGKYAQSSVFNPSVVNSEGFGGYCDWCWRVGHKEAHCWFKPEYMRSNPSQDPLQRDIRERSNMSEKGQGHSQPKGKSKGKGKGKRKHSGKGNHNQDQAGSPNEDEQVYNVKELNLSVMSKRMMILRVTVWIEQLLCFAFRSAIVFQWIRRNCRVRRRESLMGMRSQRALMKIRSVNGRGTLRRWMSR